MVFMSIVVVALPPAPTWPGQEAYEQVFGAVPRIVLASILAFWAGEFANSYVLARMKVWTRGKHLWTRTIGSTFVGQGVDSLIFYPLAFYGIWETELLLQVLLIQWALKVGWEVLLNRAGTTFKKLPDADKQGVTEKKAIALMLAQPSMIKRPVLEAKGKLTVGFKPEDYKALFR